MVANTLNIQKPTAAGQPCAVDLRRSDHPVSRVRPRPSRHAVERELSAAVEDLGAARLLIPSQYNEMWAREPVVLANWQTLPDRPAHAAGELLNKVLSAQKFNQGYATTEYLAAALVDQEWHLISASQAPKPEEVAAFRRPH